MGHLRMSGNEVGGTEEAIEITMRAEVRQLLRKGKMKEQQKEYQDNVKNAQQYTKFELTKLRHDEDSI